jgi:hypothetical protein
MRRVRRHLPLITIVVCQVLLAGLALLLYLVTRPAFAGVYESYPGRIPTLARLALSSWFLPALPVVTAACDALALAMPRRSLRNFGLGLGLVVPALGLALAAYGLFVPLFEVAPAR